MPITSHRQITEISSAAGRAAKGFILDHFDDDIDEIMMDIANRYNLTSDAEIAYATRLVRERVMLQLKMENEKVLRRLEKVK